MKTLLLLCLLNVISLPLYSMNDALRNAAGTSPAKARRMIERHASSSAGATQAAQEKVITVIADQGAQAQAHLDDHCDLFPEGKERIERSVALLLLFTVTPMISAMIDNVSPDFFLAATAAGFVTGSLVAVWAYRHLDTSEQRAHEILKKKGWNALLESGEWKKHLKYVDTNKYKALLSSKNFELDSRAEAGTNEISMAERKKLLAKILRTLPNQSDNSPYSIPTRNNLTTINSLTATNLALNSLTATNLALMRRKF